MRNEDGIRIHPNATVIKPKRNRRISVIKGASESKVFIECARADMTEEELKQPTTGTFVKRNVRFTKVCIDRESIPALIYALMYYYKDVK
jgi:hypothetical protein